MIIARQIAAVKAIMTIADRLGMADNEANGSGGGG